MRAVQRVSDDADELLGGVPRQAGVRVERDAVAHAWEDRRVADLHVEGRVRGTAQEAVELFNLAPLALPSHPRLFLRVPAADPVEEVEPVRASFCIAGIEGLDARTGGRQNGLVLRHVAREGVGEIAEDGEVNARVQVAERHDLDVLDQGVNLRHARQQRGHDHHGPCVLGDARQHVEAWKTPGRRQVGGEPLNQRDGDLAGRQDQEQRHPGLRGERGAVRTQVEKADHEQQRRHESDRPEIGRRRVSEDEPPDTPEEGGPVGHVRLEVATTLPDEVVADMRGALGGRAGFRGLACALHRPQADAHLRFAGGIGQFLHGLPVAIATDEVHARVHAGRVALQHALDQAHGLEVMTPVQRGAEAETRDDVGHRDLGGRLTLMLAADRILRRHVLGGQVVLHGRAHGRQPEAVLAHALEETDEVGGGERGGQRRGRGLARGVNPRDVGVGGLPRRPGLERLLRQPAEVLEEGQLQHAGPGPQLANGQRRHRLVAVQEPDELVALYAAVAVTNQLDGQSVDTRMARQFPQRQLRELAVVASWEVVADVEDLRRHQVEVVEEPLPRRRHELSPMHVLREDAVGLVQDTSVLLEPREDAPRQAPRDSGQP